MKTFDIRAADAYIEDDNGTVYTMRADQLEKHRSMFPEIEADDDLRAKANALREVKLDRLGNVITGAK